MRQINVAALTGRRRRDTHQRMSRSSCPRTGRFGCGRVTRFSTEEDEVCPSSTAVSSASSCVEVQAALMCNKRRKPNFSCHVTYWVAPHGNHGHVHGILFFSVVWGVVIMAVFLLPVVSSARVFNAIETVFGAASDSLISWHQWLGHTCGQRSAENQHNADLYH